MQFVKDQLQGTEDEEFNEEEFEECFADFDKDGSGTIEKDEMAEFVKELGLLNILNKESTDPGHSARIDTQHSSQLKKGGEALASHRSRVEEKD